MSRARSARPGGCAAVMRRRCGVRCCGASRRRQEGLADKRTRMTLPLPAAEPAAIASLRAFDEHISAPLHGFRDADDYYARASCFSYLSHIAVPTLIVHALDDPFMPPAVIPRAEQLSPQIRLELTARGGHVGFIGGTPRSPRFWLEDRIYTFFA